MKLFLLELGRWSLTAYRLIPDSRNLEIVEVKNSNYEQIINEKLTIAGIPDIISYIRTILGQYHETSNYLVLVAKHDCDAEFLLRISSELEKLNLKQFWILDMDDAVWRTYSKNYLCPAALNVWIEKEIILIGYYSASRKIVNTLVKWDRPLEETGIIFENLRKEISKRLVMHEISEDICKIKVARSQNLKNGIYSNMVIETLSNMFRRAAVDYNLPSLLEILVKMITE